MPRVTILMPVYNGEPFLQEAIDNILSQTYADFLFLIINDGSTDNSDEIIHNNKDPRILYHKNEKNIGLVATLNKGIGMVETEFLARMDADDLWEKTKLQKQINLLDSRLDVGICGTSIYKFGAINGKFIFPVENEYLKVGFLFYCMMSHPSVVFRMAFLRESNLQYHADYYPAEDYKMWTDALGLTRIYNIPEPLVYYRQHENQITQNSNINQLNKSNKVKLEVLKHIIPTVSDHEISFYQTVFASLNFNSIADYKKSKKFAKRLLIENKTTKYVDQAVLRKELHRYLQIGYKGYVQNRYFKTFSIKSCWKYLSSFDWIYLSFSKNLKIMINCLSR